MNGDQRFGTGCSHDTLLKKDYPLVKRFHVALDDMWTEFFEARGTADRATTTVLNLTLCLLRGMGAQTVLKPDPDYYQDLLRAWKTILATLVEGRGSGGTLAGSVGV